MEGNFSALEQRHEMFNLPGNTEHPQTSLDSLDAGDSQQLSQFIPCAQSWQAQNPRFTVPHDNGHLGAAVNYAHGSPMTHSAWPGRSPDCLGFKRESIGLDQTFEEHWRYTGQGMNDTRSKDASGPTPMRDSSSTHARPHAAVEQKYRRTLNNKLQQLNASIPVTGKFATNTDEHNHNRSESERPESTAKPAVLDKAIQYVTHLVETYHKYEDDIEGLREQVREWLGDDDFLHSLESEDQEGPQEHRTS